MAYQKSTDVELLRAALIGYEHQSQILAGKMAEIRQELGLDAGVAAPTSRRVFKTARNFAGRNDPRAAACDRVSVATAGLENKKVNFCFTLVNERSSDLSNGTRS